MVFVKEDIPSKLLSVDAASIGIICIELLKGKVAFKLLLKNLTEELYQSNIYLHSSIKT